MMAIFDELLKNDTTKGIALGLGVVATGFLIAPVLRPAARAVVKSGIVFIEKGREKLAEAGEVFEDLVAEVRAELAEERSIAESLAEAAQRATVEPVNSHE
jgi:hypothetical protein